MVGQDEVAGLNATIEVKSQLIPQLESSLQDLQQESACPPPKEWPITMAPAHGIGALLLRDHFYAIQERCLRGSLRTWRAGYRKEGGAGPAVVEASAIRELIKKEEAEKRELKRKVESMKATLHPEL